MVRAFLGLLVAALMLCGCTGGGETVRSDTYGGAPDRQQDDRY